MKNYNIEKIYQEMELHLISSMQRNLSRHLEEEAKMGFNWTQWQSEKLKELKRFQREKKLIVNSYKNPITAEVTKQLKYQFAEGSKKEQKVFKKALRKGFNSNKKINKSFFKINDRKANKLIDSVNNDLSSANHAILRMMNDTYRQTIHKAAIFAGNGVMTKKQAIDMATKDFLTRGINCIEYANGARVNIANYSKMAVRTASARAMLQGEGEFRKKIDNPLVKISKHGTSCKLCQVWEGKILVDDVYSGGNPKDYPQYQTLSYAMSKGLYHPNCFHGLGTYYKELEDMKFDDDGPTKEAQAQYIKDINECNQEIQRFSRLEVGSLDETSIQEYTSKKNSWKKHKNKLINDNKPIELTYDEYYALNTYLGPDSYLINENLRLGIDLTDKHSIIAKNLDAALDKMPNYDGSVTRSVWINSDDIDVFMQNYKIGSITSFDEYLSTTNGDIYNPEARVQMYIKSNAGKDITKYNETEKEILFKRKCKFLVLDIDTKDDYFVKIYMEEIK